MSWQSDPKYHTPEHRRERAMWAREIKRAGSVQCAQPVCIHEDRTIHHGESWHLGHDDTGQHYIGPVHPDCNLYDAQRRGHAAANAKAKRPDVAAWFA